MKYSLAAIGFAAAAAAQGLPTSNGQCVSSYDGSFTITDTHSTSSSRLMRRQTNPDSTLALTLENGILHDGPDTGYIASNYQFQFDNPPQAGAKQTSGFSICNVNGVNELKLQGVTQWYACVNGKNSQGQISYKFYSQNSALDCQPIYFAVNPSGGSATETGGSTPTVATLTDGQPTATGVATSSPVGQLTDHQPTATEIATSAPVGQLTDHQPTATEIASSAPVGQLTDHQPTATEIASSQPVGQLTDHQPTATAIASSSPVGQLTDHQPTATAVYNATASIAPYTGAAAMPKVGNEFFAIAAGVVAAAML